MSDQKLKEATEKYIDVVLHQAEDKAGVKITETVIDATHFIDKLANSLLIVSGATLTLLVANSEESIFVLGKGSFKLIMLLLLISAIIGFLSKTCHALSNMYLNISKNLASDFDNIFDEFDNFQKEKIDDIKDIVKIEPRFPDLKKIFESFVKTMPAFLQNRVRKNIESQDGDGKRIQRQASTLAYFHVVLFIGQALLMIIAFGSAVFGIE